MLLKDSFLLQTTKSLRHWTLERSQVIFDGEKFSYELVSLFWFCLLTFNLFKDNFTTLVIG